MQVVCGSCQLNFQAPDGATGLVCPICRSPLREAQASGDAAANKNILEWHGGTLNDLMAILTAPALAVRVEVLPAQGDNVVGEVHLLAGGVSEAIFGGKSTHDALDKLRAVTPARFRIEPRLPDPVDGDLTRPGPDAGTLDVRPLAHLMRYCEQYVITCAIDVWRGSENARVDYRKGEINGVTVGGIDAPERLAEVMQWASGNYRLIVPRLTLPEAIPQAAAPAPAAPQPPAPAPAPAAAAAPPAPAPAPAPPAARAPSSSHASRTIFGMPALDLASLKAAEVAAAAAKLQQQAAGPPAAARTTATSTIVAPPPPVAPPISAPVAPPPPIAPQERQSSTKTIFGVVAPVLPADAQKPARVTAPAQPAPEAPASGKFDRKTGARKTVVPAPEIVPPPPGSLPVSAPLASAADSGRTTNEGYGAGAASAAPEVVLTRPPQAAEDRTLPVRVNSKKSRGTPVWTYVGVGFLFGLALLGIYQLVGVLAH